jgi:hypothetical protein
VVSGSNLFEVTPDWTANLRSGYLASSSGRVTMVDDGTRLLIGDGSATAFNANLGLWQRAQRGGGRGLPRGARRLAGRLLPPHGAQHRALAISGLNDVTYDPLDVATAEGRPDNLVMVLSVNRLLWLFGEQTTEVWWNSGNADFPFERNESAFIETGTVAAGTCVRVGGSVAWVGSDERGRGTVWHAQGFQPVRISTHAVERRWPATRLARPSLRLPAGGHEFYQLSVPARTRTLAAPGFTTSPPGSGTSAAIWARRGRAAPCLCGTVAFGEVVVGDREDGRLYTYDLAYYTDDGQPIRRVRQSPHVSQGEAHPLQRL